MPAPFNNLRSKLNRAIVAWLIDQGCGSDEDIFPFNKYAEKEYPNTVVRSIISKPEPNFTGNRRVTVHVIIKGQATPDDADVSRMKFDDRVARTMDALMQTDDEITLKYTAQQITEIGRSLVTPEDDSDEAQALAKQNADMADFTVIDWFEAGEGDGPENGADEEGTAWEQVLIFEAVACPSNVD